jgi:hypothetical protein
MLAMVDHNPNYYLSIIKSSGFRHRHMCEQQQQDLEITDYRGLPHLMWKRKIQSTSE